MQQIYLGVDLGGTQMRLAAVSRDGQLTTPMLSVPTGQGFTAAALRTQLQTLYAELCTRHDLPASAAIGFGITGLIRETTLFQSDFLPLLNHLNIVALAEETLGLPARIENDARCFVLAETRFGAARGARHVVGITLGTGAGGGGIVPLCVVWLVSIFGFIVNGPNQARVVQLFGKYVGTLRKGGLDVADPDNNDPAVIASAAIAVRIET